MGVFDLFFRSPDIQTAQNISDQADLAFEIRDLIPQIGGGQRYSDEVSEQTESFDIKFEPRHGWDEWCLWAVKQSPVSRIIHSVARNIISYRLESDGNKETLDWFTEEARRVNMRRVFVDLIIDWLSLGRFFLQPVYYAEGPNAGTFKKLVRMDPRTIRVFRNTEDDIRDIGPFLKTIGVEGEVYIPPGKTGTEIIGYVQNWNRQDEGEMVFFAPGELIFIPRFPTHDSPDGVSVIRENYRYIKNKILIEDAQAIMARRQVDPQLIYEIPDKWWGRRAQVIRAIREAITKHFYVFVPSGMKASVVEMTSKGEAVGKAQSHIEDQLFTGIGVADSLFRSSSSNRSVGEIQLAFFERDVNADREIFAEIIEDQLILPYLRAHGKAGRIVFAFEDLTPEDKLKKQQTLVPLVAFMTKSMAKKYFTDLGYPPEDNELDELMKNLKSFSAPKADKNQPAAPKEGKKKREGEDEDDDGGEGEA